MQQQQHQHQEIQPSHSPASGKVSASSTLSKPVDSGATGGALNATRTGAVKLSNVEAQRIIALLDESIDKVRALSLATAPAFLSSDPAAAEGLLGSFAQSLSSEAQDALVRHMELERRYMALLAESAADEETDRALDEAAAAVYTGTRECTRVLMREGVAAALAESATAGSVSAGSSGKGVGGASVSARNAGVSVPGFAPDSVTVHGLRDHDEALALTQLVGTLGRIREITFKRLLTTAEEERSRWEFVAEVMEKERVATANVRKLQQELATEKKSRERDVSLRHDVIERLKDELSELRMLNAERIKSSEKQSKEREASELQHFQAKENALSQQARHLKTELATSLKQNRENEETLRKRKLKLERDVSEWIEKYDQDMEERHTELEELKDTIAREKRNMAAYEEHFAAQKERQEEVEKQLSRERELIELREKEYLKIFIAASKIQAMWRASKIRKVFKERMRKKRKGKKGKKKRR